MTFCPLGSVAKARAPRFKASTTSDICWGVFSFSSNFWIALALHHQITTFSINIQIKRTSKHDKVDYPYPKEFRQIVTKLYGDSIRATTILVLWSSLHTAKSFWTNWLPNWFLNKSLQHSINSDKIISISFSLNPSSNFRFKISLKTWSLAHDTIPPLMSSKVKCCGCGLYSCWSVYEEEFQELEELFSQAKGWSGTLYLGFIKMGSLPCKT